MILAPVVLLGMRLRGKVSGHSSVVDCFADGADKRMAAFIDLASARENTIITTQKIETLLKRGAGDNAAVADLPIQIDGPVWRGRNAVVYRVQAPNLPGPAALKFCRHWATGRPHPQAARRQFEALSKVDQALGARRFQMRQSFA